MSSLNVKKIMVVDDEQDVLTIISQYLIRWGYDVTAIPDPEDALKMFREKPPVFSVVLSDVRMPGISGVELATRLRELNQDVKVIMMTAFEMDDFICATLPFIKKEDILHKPIRLEQVCTAVKKQLGGS